MSGFKYSSALTGALLAVCVPFSSGQAADNAYYLFGQYRYFGPKLDIDFVPDGIEDNQTSGKRFYGTLAKHRYTFLKNTGRTYKEAMSFGGWDMPYRLMSGFEYDFHQNKTSSGSYGRNDKSGSFFLLGDKAIDGYSLFMGGGVVFNRYDSGYDNALSSKHENYMAALHAVYNNLDWKIRARSLLMLGYGNTDNKRLADISGNVDLFKAGYHSWYYGWENTLSKTFKFNNFYVQSAFELNAYGVRQDKIEEDKAGGNALSAEAKNSFRLDGLAGLYAGYTAKDKYGNRYNIKAGPDLSYLFSNPYDAFYLSSESGDDIYIKKSKEQKDYVTWKIYFNGYFQNGMGVYSDFRYYKKDKDSIAFALGLNYRF